jgi:hypothetical protein
LSLKLDIFFTDSSTVHLLLKWLKLARKWTGVHRHVVEDLEANIDKNTLEEWRAMVAAWDKDKSKPDPYAEPEASKRFTKPFNLG